MANVLDLSYSENEGSVLWELESGSATLSNSTDQAYDGTKSLKIASTASGNIIVRTDDADGNRFPITAGESITTTFHVRASVSRWVTASIDWFDASNAYINNVVLDGSANANTGAWEERVDTSTAPAGTASGILKIQYDANASGQNCYIDGVTIDDPSVGGGGSPVGIPMGIILGIE